MRHIKHKKMRRKLWTGGDAYVQEVYTVTGIKGSSTGKRIDKKKDQTI